MYVSAGTGIAHFVGTSPFKQSYLMESCEIVRGKDLAYNMVRV